MKNDSVCREHRLHLVPSSVRRLMAVWWNSKRRGGSRHHVVVLQIDVRHFGISAWQENVVHRIGDVAIAIEVHTAGDLPGIVQPIEIGIGTPGGACWLVRPQTSIAHTQFVERCRGSRYR